MGAHAAADIVQFILCICGFLSYFKNILNRFITIMKETKRFFKPDIYSTFRSKVYWWLFPSVLSKWVYNLGFLGICNYLFG